MRTIQDMIHQEVLCCMSSVVNALAQGYGLVQSASVQSRNAARDLDNLTEQAFELASPITDYEEAAIQAGWNWDKPAGEFRLNDNGEGMDAVDTDADGDWQRLCENHDIDPYDREVFEHWAVTDWFADKLIEEGEKVDKDFAGLCVWARTTTGQAIYADGLVERIYAKMMQPEKVED